MSKSCYLVNSSERFCKSIRPDLIQFTSFQFDSTQSSSIHFISTQLNSIQLTSPQLNPTQPNPPQLTTKRCRGTERKGLEDDKKKAFSANQLTQHQALVFPPRNLTPVVHVFISPSLLSEEELDESRSTMQDPRLTTHDSRLATREEELMSVSRFPMPEEGKCVG